MATSSSKRTILQQGQLDGFCLLYAVLNGFSAIYPGIITSDQPSNHQKTLWRRLIGVTPSLQNFASFGSSITDIPKTADVDACIKESLMNQYAEVLSHWLRDERHNKTRYSRVEIELVSKSEPSDIRTWYNSMLSSPFPENCAYIACLKECKSRVLEYGPTNEHWIAIVGNTGKKLGVACSYTAHHRGDDYKECILETGQQKRAYNNLITKRLTSTSVFSDSRYRISIC